MGRNAVAAVASEHGAVASSQHQHPVLRRLISLVLWFVVSVLISQFMTYLESNSSFSGILGDGVRKYENTIERCVVPSDAISTRLDDIGGMQSVKQDVIDCVILPLKNPHLFFQPSGPFATSRGLILTGPPGCGKTLLMKALAKECGVPFLHPSASTLQNKYFGETPKLLQALFAYARKVSPCLMFIDEIDSLFRARNDQDSGAEYNLKCEFLALMDGVCTSIEDKFIVCGATNHVEMLDPALRRRLPVSINIDLPTHAERCDIFRLLVKDEEDSASALKAFVAIAPAETDRMSGSDLSELYRTICRSRIRQLHTTTPPRTQGDELLTAKEATSSSQRPVVHLSNITKDDILTALKTVRFATMNAPADAVASVGGVKEEQKQKAAAALRRLATLMFSNVPKSSTTA